MMLAYYGDRISPHMTESPEGYLICHDVPIARTGPQEYLARELALDGDPERVVSVDRRPEDVFEAATLASFEGKPVTDEHPPENVGPENFAAYTKGHVQNVRRVGKHIVGDLYINDAVLASEVKNGAKREVSCGYLCEYVPDGAGYRQTKIRGNHVAVVPRGRAGREVAIQDAAAQAEKGNIMKDFRKRLLSLFGQAAKDATPEELEEMARTTADALDAEPAPAVGKPHPSPAGDESPAARLEAEPAGDAPETEPAEDAMVEEAPKGDDLGSKLDRILEMLEAKARGGRGEHPLHDESDLDEMIEKLAGKKDPEAAVTIPAEKMEDGRASDSAVELLKKVRPAVAAISDPKERARVVDSLISSFRDPSVMGKIAAAAQDSAQANAQKTKTNYEQMCKDAEEAYAARNPHKKEA